MASPLGPRMRLRLFFPLLLAGVTTPVEADPKPQRFLATVAEVRALTTAEAKNHPPIRLRAQATFDGRFSDRGVIVDETGGIFATGLKNADIRPGSIVEIEGEAEPGGYAPSAMVRKHTLLGLAPLPAARRVSLATLSDGAADCELIEVEGIVRAVTPQPNGRFDLDLQLSDGRFKTRVVSPTPAIHGLVDSVVRVRGVCFTRYFNQQFIEPWLLVADGADYVISQPAPADAFALPVQPISSLLTFRPNGIPRHRVKVRGSVLSAQPGQPLYLRDETRALTIRTAEFFPCVPGDTVEAIGFPALEGFLPVLEDSACRKVAPGAVPEARDLKIADSLKKSFAGDLVRCQATLLSQAHEPATVRLVLSAQGSVFPATLARSDATDAFRSLETGSTLALTGIWQVGLPKNWASATLLEFNPESLGLLVRSPADIALLRPPPFWERRATWRAAYVVGAVFLTGLVVFIVRAGRRLRNEEAGRAAAQAQFNAVLKERSRVARELHDTLAQGLAAISLQLESAKDKVLSSPAVAIGHIDLSRALVRDSLSEARKSITQMRSQILEENDLSGAFARIGQQLTLGMPTTFSQEVTGTPRRLPTEVENNLLRIGQEALTNAIRHAGARGVSLHLHYSLDAVRLLVRDDGAGFIENPADVFDSHFGLVGMRERVLLIGGQFTLRTAPGAGTEIEVSVPASRPLSDA